MFRGVGGSKPSPFPSLHIFVLLRPSQGQRAGMPTEDRVLGVWLPLPYPCFSFMPSMVASPFALFLFFSFASLPIRPMTLATVAWRMRLSLTFRALGSPGPNCTLPVLCTLYSTCSVSTLPCI
jgi:hypothetical protein